MPSILLKIYSAILLVGTKLVDLAKAVANLSSTLGRIEGKVDQIIDLLSPTPAARIIFDVELEGEITHDVKEIKMTDTQTAVARIKIVDKKGNPGVVDGAPEWATSNSEVVSVEPVADGMSAVVSAVGPLGTATVSVKADADLGEGITPLVGALDVTITGGAATTITISLDPPTEQ